MNKIKSFYKNNWIFLLWIIPFVLICIKNRIPDNDIWFLLTLGRYVVQEGIPHIDPFTIHEGLSYIMQQWTSASIFWLIFSKLGKKAFLILIYFVSFTLFFLFYKLCHTVSKNKYLSVIITTIVFTLISEYIILRPQIFTYIFLLSEILLVELYISKKNKKYLYPLPIISFLQVNFHASMWYFQFVFLLPFLLNSINIKNVTIEKVNIKPILIVMIFMIIAGLINPYGIEALTYIFKSYGINSINTIVSEMRAPNFIYWKVKVFLGYIFLFVLLLCFNKKVRLDIRYFLFFCGGTLLGFMHLKMFPFTIMIYSYVLAYAIKDIKKIKIKIFNKKWVKALNNGITIGISLSLIISFFYTIYLSLNNYDFQVSSNIRHCTDYILDNYDKDDIILYVNFNNGGYTEYKGLKSYIDGRAELFFKKFNNKEDIFDEWIAITKSTDDSVYEEFINKYQFTHIISEPTVNYNFDKFLQNNDNYELVYTEYFIPETEDVPLMKVYVKKGFGE